MKPIYRVTQPGDVEGRSTRTVAYVSDMELAQQLKRSGFGSGAMGAFHGRVLTEKVYEDLEDLPRDMRVAVKRLQKQDLNLEAHAAIIRATAEADTPQEAIKALIRGLGPIQGPLMVAALADQYGLDSGTPRTDNEEV